MIRSQISIIHPVTFNFSEWQKIDCVYISLSIRTVFILKAWYKHRQFSVTQKSCKWLVVFIDIWDLTTKSNSSHQQFKSVGCSHVQAIRFRFLWPQLRVFILHTCLVLESGEYIPHGRHLLVQILRMSMRKIPNNQPNLCCQLFLGISYLFFL